MQLRWSKLYYSLWQILHHTFDIPVSLKGGGSRLAFLEVNHVVIIFPLPAWFGGTRVRPTPGNLNSLSEKLSLGYFSKSSTAEERNDFAIEEGFLKKWFSLEKGWLNQLGAFCRMCGFHWLFHWKLGQCHRQGCPASCQPAYHAVEQWAPKTCLPQPQPELEGLQGPQGAAANPTGSGSCRAWWYVPKQRGFAALGSLISEGLPLALPEGKGYRQLCVSKSLGVHGEAEEIKKRMFYLGVPWGTKFQILTMFFQQCKSQHALCCLQAI